MARIRSLSSEWDSSPAIGWAWLSRGALVLSAVIVIARCTMMESTRDPFDVVPGPTPLSHGPGAATGVVLDLLALVPALLVLARAALDRSFQLRCSWASFLLIALGGWALCSVGWAADKFAAAVAASHLFAAASIAWAMVQAVRRGTHVRIAAGVCFGLLIVYLSQGLYYRFIDYPENVRYWNEHKQEVLKERGWAADSFSAKQFEQKVLGGEIVGFAASPNTFAAVIVMLGIVTAGVAIQRYRDGDGKEWILGIGCLLVAAMGVITLARSRTAFATPFLATVILLAIWNFRSVLARRPVRVYVIVTSTIVLLVAATLAHGIHFGTFFPEAQSKWMQSINFRWRYWEGAARLVAQHPFTGVGWDNFGQSYLAVRDPQASEEIRDPHNFLVRVAAELGVIGAVLAIAWLLRFGWEATQVSQRLDVVREEFDPRLKTPSTSAVVAMIAIGGLGFFVNAIAAIDWSQQSVDAVLELLKRLLFICAFLIGSVPAIVKSLHNRELDDRPAPWIAYTILAALAIFLVHNLIDFSLFETGPMFAFMFLAGVGLGARLPEPDEPVVLRRWPKVLFALTIAAWGAALIGFVGPVVSAETSAKEADDALRSNRVNEAIAGYQHAADRLGYNSDYAYRLARGLTMRQAPPSEVFAVLDRAIAANPLSIDARLFRVNLAMALPTPDSARAADELATILMLNPNNVEFRLKRALVLEELGKKDEARAEYEMALLKDSQLLVGEPKRLTQEQIDSVKGKIAALR